MTIGGAFLGGGVELVPAGSCKLVLEIRTEDGQNLATTFSVVGGGQIYTATAGADGRAELIVPSGVTYTVTTSATGYDGLTAQTVIGDSATVQYVRFEATLPRVKKSGDTMSGNLYIEASSNRFVYIKRTDLDRDVEQTFPTSGTTPVGGFIVVDKDGGAIGGINRAVSPSEVSVTLQNSQAVNGTLRHCNLSLKIAKDGSMYATVPTPSSPTDNSTKIATTGWINTASSVVHTTGNEKISGAKTFTGQLITKSSTYIPAVITHTTVDVSKNDNTEAYLYFKGEVGDRTLGRVGFSNQSNLKFGFSSVYNSTWYTLGFVFDKTTNKVWGNAPSTPSGATGTEIATADWVNGKLATKQNTVVKQAVTSSVDSSDATKFRLMNVNEGDLVTISVSIDSSSAGGPLSGVFIAPSMDDGTEYGLSNHLHTSGNSTYENYLRLYKDSTGYYVKWYVKNTSGSGSYRDFTSSSGSITGSLIRF